MAFLSLTRLHVRSWYYLPAFLLHASRSSRQAQRAPGFIMGALSADLPRRTFWTVTVWTDQAAMRAYQFSSAHKIVMSKIGAWCDEGSVARMENAAEALPAGDAALEHMRQDGRITRLPDPSPAHATGATVPDGRAPHFAAKLKPLNP